MKISGDPISSEPVERMLAEPGLVVSESVQVLDELEVLLEGERRVDAGLVHRCDERPELESCHGVSLIWCNQRHTCGLHWVFHESAIREYPFVRCRTAAAVNSVWPTPSRGDE